MAADITVSKVLNADPEALNASAGAWGRWAATVLNHSGYIRDQVVDPISTSWQGIASELAKSNVNDLRDQMATSAGTLQDVENALVAAGKELASAKTEMTAAINAVNQKYFAVDDTSGTVTVRPNLTAADLGVPAASLKTQLATLTANLPGLQAPITKALSDARTADGDAASALDRLRPPKTQPAGTDNGGPSGLSATTSPAAVDPGVTFTVPPATGGSTGAALANYAKKYLGIAYLYGGESTNGFDCSGLVQTVFDHFGIKLPRTADMQATMGTQFTNPSELRPGDLVFSGWGGDVGSNGVGHVGIYAGHGMVLEASQPGTVVHYVPLNANYLSHVKWFARDTG